MWPHTRSAAEATGRYTLQEDTSAAAAVELKHPTMNFFTTYKFRQSKVVKYVVLSFFSVSFILFYCFYVLL